MEDADECAARHVELAVGVVALRKVPSAFPADFDRADMVVAGKRVRSPGLREVRNEDERQGCREGQRVSCHGSALLSTGRMVANRERPQCTDSEGETPEIRVGRSNWARF